MSKYRITFLGSRGTIYSHVSENKVVTLEVGEWNAPFPNEHGNSQAIGLLEGLFQSDYCPFAFLDGENIVTVKVEEVK